MLNFQDYQRMNQSTPTAGRAHTAESRNIVEASWNNDPASTIAYFYDYEHDDERDKNYDLHPEQSKTKIPVEIKYIINTYTSLEKDSVDYRIMFKPSYKCTIPYYDEKFGDVIHSTFPTGLYCDIMDADGIWKKWLVVSTANEDNRDFPNYSILPCGYRYQWVHNGKKCQMWGVERSQSSYNSGVFRDYRIEHQENQCKMILPYNEITRNLYYNDRLIVSVDLPQPITWRITKVEGLLHKGVIVFALYQDLFDDHHDYIERDADGKLIGMWANYYQDGNLPTIEEPDPEILPQEIIGDYAEITYSGLKPQLKINGGYKTISIAYYNSGELLKNQTPGEWLYLIDDTDVSDLIGILPTDSPNSFKIKFLGDENYLHKVLTIKNVRDEVIAETKFELICL